MRPNLKNTSRTTIQAYYPLVRTLREHLRDVLSTDVQLNSSAVIVDSQPSDAYEELLDTCLIGVEAIPEQWQAYRPAPPMAHMSEVLERSLVRIFKRHKGTGLVDDLLALGFRSSGKNSKNWNPRLPGIEQRFVNTLHTGLQSPTWEELLQRIGMDATMHLLTETSVFLALPNDCLCQMTGPPLVFKKVPELLRPEVPIPAGRNSSGMLKRKAPTIGPMERPLKRARLNTDEPLEDVAIQAIKATRLPPINSQVRTPADVVFARNRMLYARPVRVPDTDQLIVGLPPTHVLHRLRPSYHRPRKNALPVVQDAREQEAAARHLSKYIFPRQFRLMHVFDAKETARTGGTWQYSDWTDREAEIKAKGVVKTPKRVKPALELCEKMLYYHTKCGYKPLLKKACPSKVQAKAEGGVVASQIDSTVILEMMSEVSISLSQMYQHPRGADVDEQAADIMTVTPPEAELAPPLPERTTVAKPRFAEFACSVGEVWRYTVLVTDAVIPRAFWGGKDNRKHVLESVKTFIMGRRFDAFSLHWVLQGIKTASMTWIEPTRMQDQKPSRNQHVSVSDSLKRRELVEEFIFWYFDSFVTPLLKTTFYVTESSAFRNRVLYYRQDDWATLCQPLIDRLTQSTFRRLEPSVADEMLRQRKLGFSFVRLLPKETGVRPIVNLRRRKALQKVSFSQKEPSINQILQAAFQILAYEKNMSSSLMGASILGGNELYGKLKAFKARLLSDSNNSELPKLYCVKVDVQACFDTITQDKLLGILREVITEEEYLIQRFAEVMPAAGKIRRTFRRKAFPDYDHPDFLMHATELAASLRHTIFVDQVAYPSSTRDGVLALLEEHITENLVKIGNEYYQQVIGIPQGSIISSLLCSIFYGDLEKVHLKHLTEDPHSMLVRLIDDYLFVTTDKSKACDFLATMKKGHPEYGCFVSEDKTMSNFRHASHTSNSVPANQKAFPWCGYLIDMHTLAISADHSRFRENYLQDSLTIHLGRAPGSAFKHKLLQFAKHRSHIIYCDTLLNSVDGVYRNIYDNFLLAAAKMHRYIRAWGIVPWNETIFLLSAIHETVQYSYASIKSHAASSASKYADVQCDVHESHVTWLGVHAFHATLSRKPTQYQKILKSLARDLDRPSCKTLRKRFAAIIRDSPLILRQLYF